MTERGPATFPVIGTVAAIFCLALIWLALQVRAGEDPAIGAGPAPQAQQARPVIHRRVIIRRLVETPGAGGATGGDVPGGAPTSAAPSSASSAPAPAAAPAPAPAPAPVVTRAS